MITAETLFPEHYEIISSWEGGRGFLVESLKPDYLGFVIKDEGEVVLSFSGIEANGYLVLTLISAPNYNPPYQLLKNAKDIVSLVNPHRLEMLAEARDGETRLLEFLGFKWLCDHDEHIAIYYNGGI